MLQLNGTRESEMLLSRTYYGKPIDMWGVGYILFELVFDDPLLTGKSTKIWFVWYFKLMDFLIEKNLKE